MAGNDIAVIVAKAEVGEAVRLDLTKTDKIRIHAGQPFAIRFAYRVWEESNDEDLWTFRLASRLGDGEEAVSTKQHQDRAIARDDIWSHLSQDHICHEPGEYELAFNVGAALKRRTWGDASPHKAVDEKNVGGTLRIEAV